MRSEVGIDPQSLCYGFSKEIMDHPRLNWISESVGLDVPNLMKDVPNLVKDVPNFLE